MKCTVIGRAPTLPIVELNTDPKRKTGVQLRYRRILGTSSGPSLGDRPLGDRGLGTPDGEAADRGRAGDGELDQIATEVGVAGENECLGLERHGVHHEPAAGFENVPARL